MTGRPDAVVVNAYSRVSSLLSTTMVSLQTPAGVASSTCSMKWDALLEKVTNMLVSPRAEVLSSN